MMMIKLSFYMSVSCSLDVTVSFLGKNIPQDQILSNLIFLFYGHYAMCLAEIRCCFLCADFGKLLKNKKKNLL
jgi:hypothetical protein